MNNIRAKFFLIIYLVGVVVPAVLSREIVKLPALVQHYYRYEAPAPEQSLLNFLEQHYGKQYRYHQSAHDHSKLPGKGAHDVSAAASAVAIANEVPCWILVALPAGNKSGWLPAATLLPNPYLAEIWQPPRA